MQTINLGIDVGNYDTKSAHTTIISGFKVFSSKPELSQEYVKFNDKFFVSTNERFPYKMDKTENEQAAVLTLFAIGKEILFRINRKGIFEKEDQQAAISKISKVNLGVGVPPLHCNMLSAKTKEYYLNNFNHVDFTYCDYQFSFNVNNVYVFPQAFSAIQNNKKCRLILEYPKVYVVDIGGYTVDVLTMVNGKPDLSIVASKPLGVLKLYQELKDEILRLKGFSVDDFAIESVMTGRKHALHPDIVTLIQEHADRWAGKIVNELRESGIEFQAYPCVFLGGGSLLFRRSLNRNPILGIKEILTDTHANAAGYERMLNAICPTK